MHHEAWKAQFCQIDSIPLMLGVWAQLVEQLQPEIHIRGVLLSMWC